MFDNLHRDNVLLFAIKSYDKPNCVLSELDEDIKHFSYVKRLFRRYLIQGELKERLILNHLMILYNLFGPAATRLLFYHSKPDEYAALKTFLLFLNYLPDRIDGIRGTTIVSSDIPIDPGIVRALRKLMSNGSLAQTVDQIEP
jgi:hypothetical protein